MKKEDFEKEYREVVEKLIDGSNRMVKIDPNWCGISEKDKEVMRAIFLSHSIEQVKHQTVLSLLIKNKIITEDEYTSLLCLNLQTEKKRYEKLLSATSGIEVKL